MEQLRHSELSDKEKLFYGGEASFVDASAAHFRALASVAATEVGFLIASLTLAGTNQAARSFVLVHKNEVVVIALALLATILAGVFQGYFFGLAQWSEHKGLFLPWHTRIAVSKQGKYLTADQAHDLMNLADRVGKRNRKKSACYEFLRRLLGVLAGAAFGFANGYMVWLVWRFVG